jgi:hypothetical protein
MIRRRAFHARYGGLRPGQRGPHNANVSVKERPILGRDSVRERIVRDVLPAIFRTALMKRIGG